jgi:hypothetical protein
MVAATPIAYDVNNDKDNAHIVCTECADGYDVSTYRIVSQNEANEYGDECDVCKRVLYTD